MTRTENLSGCFCPLQGEKERAGQCQDDVLSKGNTPGLGSLSGRAGQWGVYQVMTLLPGRVGRSAAEEGQEAVSRPRLYWAMLVYSKRALKWFERGLALASTSINQPGSFESAVPTTWFTAGPSSLSGAHSRVLFIATGWRPGGIRRVDTARGRRCRLAGSCWHLVGTACLPSEYGK